MDGLRRFVCHTSWPLLLTGCAVFVAFFTLAAHVPAASGPWIEAKADFIHYESRSRRAACESCQTEAAKLDKSGILLASGLTPNYPFAYRWCATLECPARDPGPFGPYYVKTYFSDGTAALALWGWLSVVGLFALARLYAAERSTGWRRVALTAGPATALVATFVDWPAAHAGSDVPVICFVGLVLGFAGTLCARRIHAWVSEGFRKDVPASAPVGGKDQESPSSLVAPPLSLRSGAGKKVAVAVAIALLFLTSFLANPGHALEAMVSASVQALGIGVMVYVGRLVINAIQYWRK
jgi:hypothetical protein